MDAAAQPNKRRKRDALDARALARLPSDPLVSIAEYLSKPSRALLAVSLTAPSKSWRAAGWRGEPSQASRAIVLSTSWEVLDFDEDMDIKKLSDDDVGALLSVIDARDALKQLRFWCKGGRGLIGDGLEPLRGSKVLSKIDFGAHGSLDKVPWSEEVVLPILDNILNTDGNSLREIWFPLEWRCTERRMEQPLREFSLRFVRLLEREEGGHDTRCEACFEKDSDYATTICAYCDFILCGSCGDHIICVECEQGHCAVCAERNDVDAAVSCDGIYCRALCPGCIVPTDCGECSSLWNPRLIKENNQLWAENEQLQAENDRLRHEVEVLRTKRSSGLGTLPAVDEDEEEEMSI